MTERKKFLLRLPTRLHEELRAWAEQEMRSLNGQIEYLLREAVHRAGRRGGEDPGPKGKEKPSPDDS